MLVPASARVTKGFVVAPDLSAYFIAPHLQYTTPSNTGFRRSHRPFKQLQLRRACTFEDFCICLCSRGLFERAMGTLAQRTHSRAQPLSQVQMVG